VTGGELRRPVRSFVLRQGRMSPAQHRAYEEALALSRHPCRPLVAAEFAALFRKELVGRSTRKERT